MTWTSGITLPISDDEEPNREAPPLTDLETHIDDLWFLDYLDCLEDQREMG